MANRWRKLQLRSALHRSHQAIEIDSESGPRALIRRPPPASGTFRSV